MSRIGKLPITIPAGVEVKTDSSRLTTKGPKGELELKLPRAVSAEVSDSQVVVKLKNARQPALWGLVRTLIANMVIGVNTGFQKQLEIHGVGYRAQATAQTLTLNVGYSHSVEYAIPAGIEIKVEGNVITVSGIDKQQVGQVAADIRDTRRPEPYKGKGIRYVGEQVRRKAGKAAGKAEA